MTPEQYRLGQYDDYEPLSWEIGGEGEAIVEECVLAAAKSRDVAIPLATAAVRRAIDRLLPLAVDSFMNDLMAHLVVEDGHLFFEVFTERLPRQKDDLDSHWYRRFLLREKVVAHITANRVEGDNFGACVSADKKLIRELRALADEVERSLPETKAWEREQKKGDRQ